MGSQGISQNYPRSYRFSDKAEISSDEESDEDYSSPPVKNVSKPTRMHYHSTTSPEYESMDIPKTKSKGQRSLSWKPILSFLAVISLAYFAWYYFKPEKPCLYDGITPESLGANFKNQPKDLKYIVQSFFEKARVTVDSLVLMHSHESRETANCLAKQLAQMFAYYRRQECNYTSMHPDDINSNDSDFGAILKKYEGTAAVTVVFDLLQISPNNAQIFHTLCDDITPRVKPSLFVFMLSSSNTPDCSTCEARRILRSQWEELPDNVLNPLLARILGHVITVSPEHRLPC